MLPLRCPACKVMVDVVKKPYYEYLEIFIAEGVKTKTIETEYFIHNPNQS